MKARIWKMKFGKKLEIQKLKTNYRLLITHERVQNSLLKIINYVSI